MNNEWTRINEAVKCYMRDVCRVYSMRCEKISDLESIIYNERICILIQIDRFHVELLYVFKNGEEVKGFRIGDYLAMRFDDTDRRGIIKSKEAGDDVKNSLIIIANGLISKCSDVLTGNMNWINKYKQSSRYSEVMISTKTVHAIQEKLPSPITKVL